MEEVAEVLNGIPSPGQRGSLGRCRGRVLLAPGGYIDVLERGGAAAWPDRLHTVADEKVAGVAEKRGRCFVSSRP
jgi:hypothetical protein